MARATFVAAISAGRAGVKGCAGVVRTGPGAPTWSVGRYTTTAEENAAVLTAFPNLRRPRTWRTCAPVASTRSCHQAVSARTGTRVTTVAPACAASNALDIQAAMGRP
jgi:hypothetical protein